MVIFETTKTSWNKVLLTAREQRSVPQSGPHRRELRDVFSKIASWSTLPQTQLGAYARQVFVSDFTLPGARRDLAGIQEVGGEETDPITSKSVKPPHF